MSEKLDIFEVLKNIDLRDITYFDDLTEQERKTIAPVVLMRWLSGTRTKEQILMVNMFLNQYVFNLYNHPKLLYKLGVVSSTGPKQYKWLKKMGRGGKYPASVDVVADYYNCGLSEAIEYVKIMTLEDVLAIATESNATSDVIKAINNEFK